MENSKRSKQSNRGVPSTDRISTLPESLICHILSLLPTHYAVQTCILSKRWQYLWTYATSVAFNDNEFCEFVHKRFDHFVSRCLALLKTPSLEQFHLSCEHERDAFNVSTWVYAALSRNVQKLILNVYLPEQFDIPIGLFSCKTLSYLSLNSTTMLDVPNSVCLPNLTCMIISGVYYESEETLPTLLSGCPALEDLSIDRDEMDNIFHFTISSPTLKSLVLTFTTEIKPRSPPHTLQIDAPLLQYMHLYDCMSNEFVIGNLSSLSEADINVDLNRRNIDETGYGKEVFKLINKLSNVKFLNLFDDTMKVLSYAGEPVAPASFHNLTGLKGDFRSYENKSMDIQPYYIPKYLLPHLTTVEFANFYGSTDELVMVKFILNGAKSLKRMTIITSHPETKLDLLKEITMYPRDSKLCELVVR